ncbi:hypothetical protein CKM354_000071800 [Cercospora kikuchii]|uniref:C2H2-type domain-containing protein n=1 Tax=Cercospora kikuchii TaxID=84275 RepID=A0A9P3CBD9_9PEZI|nr:uncharacterized protein CKM354_000071800 [Cercospora kikuchii]GIZ37265.1 hypothetical protein CKM354_000071800 [Cercospora kikuchii]
MAKRIREASPSTAELPAADALSPVMETSAHTPKYVELDEASERTKVAFKCLLPPHKSMTFSSYTDYETHYNSSHTNRCKECHKNFPTAHFLQLHLSENHDPIVAVRRERGDKIYACFLEDCDKVCVDWKKRRSHLVDKHGYPKNYDFLVVDNGIDGRWTMLRRGIDPAGHRKSSRDRRDSTATRTTQTTDATGETEVTTSEPTEEEVPAVQSKAAQDDTALEEVTKSMSSLKFVPRSVTFGKRKGKSGFAKS